MKTSDEVRAMILADIEALGISKGKYADLVGVHPSYLSQVLHGVKLPTPNMARRFGLERIYMYREVN